MRSHSICGGSTHYIPTATHFPTSSTFRGDELPMYQAHIQFKTEDQRHQWIKDVSASMIDTKFLSTCSVEADVAIWFELPLSTFARDLMNKRRPISSLG